MSNAYLTQMTFTMFQSVRVWTSAAPRDECRSAPRETKLKPCVTIPVRLPNHDLIPSGTQTAEPETRKLDVTEFS